MTIDAFIFPVPAKLSNDPEVADYFNQMNRALSDLTTIRGDAIISVSTTAIASPDATLADLKVAVDLLITQGAATVVAVNAILAQMRTDGAIKT